MNKFINNIFIDWRQIYAEFHLPYSACGSFTKHRKIILIFRQTGNLKHLYRNELDKACFAHDAAYFDSKALTKRTISDKIFKRFKNIITELMKLLEFVYLMDIKEHKQVWSITFLLRKQDLK